MNSREERIRQGPWNSGCGEGEGGGGAEGDPAHWPAGVQRKGPRRFLLAPQSSMIKKDQKGPIAFQGSLQECVRNPGTSPKNCWAENAVPGPVPMSRQGRGDLPGLGDLFSPLGFSPGASTT